MTVGEALKRAAARIEPLDARLLLEEASGLGSGFIFAHPEAQIDETSGERFETMVRRRAVGEPVAYIVGHAGFYGRTFAVDPRVLVPRPETEHLVEAILDHVRTLMKPRVRVADVGTGSGAIALSIAAEDERLDVVATDVSRDALAVAAENTRSLGLQARVTLLAGDLLGPLGHGRYDVLAANLPYVPSSEVPAPPHPVAYEPRLAVDGGADGLALYRRLLRGASAVLAPAGALFLEAAPGTIETLAQAAEAALPGAGIEVGADYAGLDRYVAIYLP